MCKLYVIHREAPQRLDTGGGWRRTRVRRERRWPSFIIWRWAGPARDGWTRCRWRAPPLLLPPRRQPHMARRKPRQAGLGLHLRAGGPARRRPRDRQSGQSPLRKVPAVLKAGEHPRRRAVARPGVAGSRLGARVPAGRPPGNGPKRAAAAGADPAIPWYPHARVQRRS
jgi:hypothetical protein